MSDKKRRKYDLYFPHKAGARNDPKLVKVLVKYKHAGIGIWWSLLEILRESEGYKWPVDAVSELALQLHIDDTELTQILAFFKDKKVELLKVENGYFYSPGLVENMIEMIAKSDKARESSRKRWDRERNANALPAHNGRNPKSDPNAMQGKERKGNTSKDVFTGLSNAPVSETATAPAERVEAFVSAWPRFESDADKVRAVELCRSIDPGLLVEVSNELKGPPDEVAEYLAEAYPKGGLFELLELKQKGA